MRVIGEVISYYAPAWVGGCDGRNREAEYRAFISYSHTDTSWAKWLHRGLEAFRIDKDLVGRETSTGTIPKTLHPIFRDRDDFNAGHDLTDQTLATLDASAALMPDG